MGNVLFVATVVKTHIMHFHIPYLRMFNELGWHTVVAAHNDYEKPSECDIPYCDEYVDITFERSPIKLANIKAYCQLKKVIEEGEFDIVHCHTPVAAMLARLAARRVRKQGTKVYYTAHGFHFYKGAPLLNWIVYFPVEWVCSFMTDTLVTINKEDYALAKKYMHAKQIEYVPGVGIDVKKYFDRIEARKKVCRELGIDENAFLLLSVGELNENKNHQIVIRGLKEISQEARMHYLIAGDGNKKEYLKELAKKSGVDKRVHLLGYRSDIHDLFSSADAFVFPSYREGLSVALMEAMVHELPCVVSRIRGNVDLIDNNGGCLFDPHSIDDFRRALNFILNCDAEKLGKNNFERVKEYSLERVVEKMKQIYEIR